MLTPSYPRFKGDFHGVFIHNLCLVLSNIGVEVVILAPRTRNLEPYDVKHQIIRFPYLPFKRLETLPEDTMKGAPIHRLIQLPAYLLSAILHSSMKGIDVLHTHLAIPLGFVSSYVRPQNPKILTCHGSDCTLSINNPILGTFTRTALRKSDKVVAVSDYIRRLAIKLGATIDKTETIYMGVNTDKFQPPSNREVFQKKQGLSKNSPIIGFLGRMVPEKRIEELIYAAEILDKQLDVQILLGGDGRHLPHLKELAEKKKLNNIRFLGRVTNSSVFHKLCNIFVLCSPREGLSTALQEAMATGCAPVAVAKGGTPELVRNNVNGLLYKPGDIQGLTDCLLEAINKPELGKAARKTITKHFDMRKNAQKYLDLYREVSGK